MEDGLIWCVGDRQARIRMERGNLLHGKRCGGSKDNPKMSLKLAKDDTHAFARVVTCLAFNCQLHDIAKCGLPHCGSKFRRTEQIHAKTLDHIRSISVMVSINSLRHMKMAFAARRNTTHHLTLPEDNSTALSDKTKAHLRKNLFVCLALLFTFTLWIDVSARLAALAHRSLQNSAALSYAIILHLPWRGT